MKPTLALKPNVTSLDSNYIQFLYLDQGASTNYIFGIQIKPVSEKLCVRYVGVFVQGLNVELQRTMAQTGGYIEDLCSRAVATRLRNTLKHSWSETT